MSTFEDIQTALVEAKADREDIVQQFEAEELEYEETKDLLQDVFPGAVTPEVETKINRAFELAKKYGPMITAVVGGGGLTTLVADPGSFSKLGELVSKLAGLIFGN